MNTIQETYNQNCIEVLKNIELKFDLILCDLPYNTTSLEWDVIIPMEDYIIDNKKNLNLKQYMEKSFKEGLCYDDFLNNWNKNKVNGLWYYYDKVIKNNGAIVLFSSHPFTNYLINTKPKEYKYYEIIWDKVQPTGALTVKKRPMKQHENILVFYKEQPTYNRQMSDRPQKDIRVNAIRNKNNQKNNLNYDHVGKIETKYAVDYDPTKVNPKTIIKYTKQPTRQKNLHPTQKPIELLEYLIKTYSNECELVLDNTAGSFSTAIACINTNRSYVCIERDSQYYNIGIKRINNHIMKVNNNE